MYHCTRFVSLAFVLPRKTRIVAKLFRHKLTRCVSSALRRGIHPSVYTALSHLAYVYTVPSHPAYVHTVPQLTY